jgi:5'-nucleotidase
MTLTAQQIKDALEQQFAGCRGQLASATRIMLPSAGFKYRWDGAKACDQRIHSVTLTRDGAPRRWSTLPARCRTPRANTASR